MKKYLLLFTSFLLLCNISFGKINIEKKANQIVYKMSPREKLGQLIMMDFRNWNDKPVLKIDKNIKNIIKKYDLGGIILFRENLVDNRQIIKLISSFQHASPKIPLLIATDQEGGVVTRLQHGTNMPGNMALGAGRNLKITEKIADTIGKELKALSINMDFAPVVDVNSNQKNPVIGVRSFGDNPKLVGENAVAYINGLHNEGIISTVKHFPGHGNTITDSHVGLAKINYNKKEWAKIDKIPFKMAIDNGVDAVMTAHIIIPSFDNSKIRSKITGKLMGTPATLSKPILSGVLRGELHFKGIIITDALNMKAISSNFKASDSAARAILAGADIVLMPAIVGNRKEIYKLNDLYSDLLHKMKANKEFNRRVNQSARRVIELKLKKIQFSNKKIGIKQRVRNANKIVGSKKNREIEKLAAERGITLIKNENILPIKLEKNSKILIISENRNSLNIIKNEILKLKKQVKINRIKVNYKKHLTKKLKNMINKTNYIVLTTYNLTNKTHINEIINYANKHSKKLVSISTRNPYDIMYTPNVKANLAIYGITGFDITNSKRNTQESNIRACIRTIFIGKNRNYLNHPTGKLPVSIRNSNNKIIYKFGHGLTY